MSEIQEYIDKLAEIKHKSFENYQKGNMAMARYYKRKYYDMIDNHGLMGIGNDGNGP